MWNGYGEASGLRAQRIACLLYEDAMAYLPRKHAKASHVL
jgi:hypothetical protein